MIELHDVTMTYGQGDAVLHGIDLSLEPGEVVLVCGESGCGKTSLLRLLNGVARYFFDASITGQALLEGRSIADLEAHEIAQRVGSVFQNPKSQFFTLDVRSELAFGCENLGVEPAEILRRIDQVQRDFSLGDLIERDLMSLSGGQKQKIACAAVAAMEPALLLLDEPSSNLDIGAIEELKAVVARWKEQGKTILIAEHRLYYLVDLIDRAIHMRDGRIIGQYTANEFKEMSDDELHALGLRSTRPTLRAKAGREPASQTIRLESFGFTYPGASRAALDIADLPLPAGRVIGVVGRNGAGKSTFMRCLTGLEPRARGALHLEEMRLDRPRQRLAHSYLVMQDVNHQLFGESVEADLAIGAERSDQECASRITQVLGALNLLDKRDRHPMSLSGGERQRVAIASALVCGREVIVFDEPTSGLDYRHMTQVAAELEDLAEEGRTVFVVTHDIELLSHCCDTLLLIDLGRVTMSEPCSTESLRRALATLMP